MDTYLTAESAVAEAAGSAASGGKRRVSPRSDDQKRRRSTRTNSAGLDIQNDSYCWLCHKVPVPFFRDFLCILRGTESNKFIRYQRPQFKNNFHPSFLALESSVADPNQNPIKIISHLIGYRVPVLPVLTSQNNCSGTGAG
jgi:hypothetical protein